VQSAEGQRSRTVVTSERTGNGRRDTRRRRRKQCHGERLDHVKRRQLGHTDLVRVSAMQDNAASTSFESKVAVKVREKKIK
jgi:hypothetical protein